MVDTGREKLNVLELLVCPIPRLPVLTFFNKDNYCETADKELKENKFSLCFKSFHQRAPSNKIESKSDFQNVLNLFIRERQLIKLNLNQIFKMF